MTTNDRAIITERLNLLPYYAGNVTDDHVKWLNDPEVVKYSEQRHKHHTIESVHIYVNDLWLNSGSFIWGIYVSADGMLIGTITAHCDKNNGVANIGIMIGDKSQWGNGYGAEAWSAVCNWCFNHLKMRKIEAGCHFENRRMRRLAKLYGMELEGVIHDHFIVDGRPQHLFLYGKLNPAGMPTDASSVA